jgi:hypothetical protein
MRCGAWFSSQYDDLTDDRSEVLSIYVETWFARRIGSWQIRAAPRVLWARVYRAVYSTGQSGFGIGGALALRIPLSTCLAFAKGLTHDRRGFLHVSYEEATCGSACAGRCLSRFMLWRRRANGYWCVAPSICPSLSGLRTM